MLVHLVFGTRPEIIKMAPVIHELQKRKINFSIIHTGQHFSDNMDRIFWDLFRLPEPKFHLNVREPTHAKQCAEMIKKLEEIFLQEKPNWVLVQGDTNSTMAGALTAAKIHNIKIAHIEAGLRSFDRSMPEEINRLVVDHISSLLLPPTEIAKRYLQNEGLFGDKVVVTGNTVEDTLLAHLPEAKAQSQILMQNQLETKKYLVLTIHRQENTDDEIRLLTILKSVFNGAEKQELKVIFPIHPRTRNRIEKSQFKIPSFVKLLEPIGYYDFLKLQCEAAMVASDSGGVQEETCILKIPCLTLRENTERPETVELGSNLLVGVTEAGIEQGFDKVKDLKMNYSSPYGNGLASQNIVDAIEQRSA